MSDAVAEMGTLLSKMTADTADKIVFTSNQVTAVVEMVIPKIVSSLPGMPSGMRCTVDRDDKGWSVRIDLPEGYRR